MPGVGVVIVTYRSAGSIATCLHSLRAASEQHRLQVVVIDNASDDGSSAAARAADEDIVVVDRDANDGYAVGNNAGLALLSDDVEWVLFANPDTTWPDRSVDALVAAAAAHPGAGLVSPVLVGSDGTAQPIVERDLTLRRVVRGMVRLGSRVRPTAPPETGPPVAVEWLHTAAALMPVELARRLGGFDPRFFLFAEDADLCRRVRAAGLDVLVVPEVRVGHAGGASVDASTDAGGAAALRVRAVATYLDKYEGPNARRLFGTLGALVYRVAGHRAQASAAWAEARR
ncbi:MAG TPA: glycosyltransferase family 2 protein [Acidimicrobiales bacterium]|nr:glycosyltransferase family 2 protein [Acidimicrobiales bacterium]